MTGHPKARLCALLTTAVMLTSACPAQAAAQDAAEAFNAAYGQKLAAVLATPERTDDVKLAAELLARAKSGQVAPGLKVILCEKAFELGERTSAGCDICVEAMEVLAEAVPARRDAC